MALPSTPISARVLEKRPHRLPPLEAGDHLTREEFHRRYKAMPENVKAELIEGVVYMASPVRQRSHGKPHVLLATWLGLYYGSTPLVEPGDNSTAFVDNENEPQPDLLLMIPKALGGQAVVTDEGYIDGPPEWIAEIAASSASIDLHKKHSVYLAAGVREYLVWSVHDEKVDWFERVGGSYASLPADAGVIRSRVFPGLWLDADALLADNFPRVLEVLRQGIASPEHAAFAASLAAKIAAT